MNLRSLKDIQITGHQHKPSEPGNIFLRMSQEDADLLRLLINIEHDRVGENVNKIYYEKIIDEYEDHMDFLRGKLFDCEKIIKSVVKQ